MKNIYHADDLSMKHLPDLELQAPNPAYKSEGKWFRAKFGAKKDGSTVTGSKKPGKS